MYFGRGDVGEARPAIQGGPITKWICEWQNNPDGLYDPNRGLCMGEYTNRRTIVKKTKKKKNYDLSLFSGKNVPDHFIERFDKGLFTLKVIVERTVEHEQYVIAIVFESSLRIDRVQA